MTTRVILVRHGESTYNVEKRIQGRFDGSVLTGKGCAMANQVAEALAEIPIDCIYNSPLARANQTAEIVQFDIQKITGKEIPREASELLLEVDLPLWETMQRQEVKAKYPANYQQWHEAPDKFFMLVDAEEGGKHKHYPVLALYEQAKRFWQETLPKHPNGTIVTIAHNGINRCLLGTALGIDPSYYHAIQQSNCGISVLNFEGGWGSRVQLESLNLTGHLGIPVPPLRPEHRGTRIFLVRHGETQWNRDRRFQGQIDIPLNENGKTQARQASAFLKDIDFDFAISSDLLRPKETAEIVLERHPQVRLDVYPDLREISHGTWEGKLEEEIVAFDGALLEAWKAAPETVQMPEGENLQQVWERVGKAWRDILKTYSKPNEPRVGLVVAHDAVNKALLCRLFGLEPQSFWNFKQGNGSVTVIDYPKGIDKMPVLQASNITSHIGGVLDKTAAGAL